MNENPAFKLTTPITLDDSANSLTSLSAARMGQYLSPSLVSLNLQRLIHMAAEAMQPTSDIDRSAVDCDPAQVQRKQRETSVTLRAVAIYVRDFRPPLIILENILGTPWHTTSSVFDAINYDVNFVQVDAEMLLPAAYSLAWLRVLHRPKLAEGNGIEMIGAWNGLVKTFEWPPSSLVEDFLVSDGNPQLATAFGDLFEAATEPKKARCPIVKDSRNALPSV